MSWIFSFLLACYAAVRLVLWLRGQLRWMAVRRTLPAPPPAADPPGHLSPGLAAFFTRTRALRIDLAHARCELAAVEVTDPDAPLGRVRSSRYRRALMESWRWVSAWLRSVDDLDRGERALLDERLIDPERVQTKLESLREPWRAVSRARPLDPFELAELRRVVQVLERIDLELMEIEVALMPSGEDPYRDRYRMQAAAPAA